LNWAIPTRAVPAAPKQDSSIQPMPIRRLGTASAGVRNAMKRTMMWGWPK
jgi:hypothetical protein